MCFNRLENQGTLHGLYREFNIPENQATDIGRMNVRLDDGDMFRLRDFVNVQEARTKWLWERRPQMDSLIRQASIRERPQSTLRSYCNQECEGISREAKQRCGQSGNQGGIIHGETARIVYNTV